MVVLENYLGFIDHRKQINSKLYSTVIHYTLINLANSTFLIKSGVHIRPWIYNFYNYVNPNADWPNLFFLGKDYRNYKKITYKKIFGFWKIWCDSDYRNNL